MKQIILGDTHGRDTWKKVIDKHRDWDKLIFIGDYLDSLDLSGAQQLYNLQEIIKFKREVITQGLKQVILLIGNHDFQYWPGIVGEVYSGYQPAMHASFTQVLDDNKNLFQMCFEDEEGTVYTHAGLTETFVDQRIGTYSAQQVNDVFHYIPNSFKFYNGDRSGCGDDVHQSCIWVRTGSLDRDAINKFQVVGHTTVNKIDHMKSQRRGYYMIDCIDKGEFLMRQDGRWVIDKVQV